MNILLLFFALPLAVIIISIALQKILHNSFLVAAIIFAFFIVVTFLVDDILTFLIATIIYTILSFVTAITIRFICRLINSLDCNDDENDCNNGCNNDCNNGCNNTGNNSNGLNISDTINVDSDTIDIYPNNTAGRNSYYRSCRNYRKR